VARSAGVVFHGAIFMTLLSLAAAAAALAQDTIKVHVETIQVYANVTDFKGRFVTNLKQDNFKILEDGKEQHIDAFSSDDSPLSVGLIFDVNGFMGDNFPLARQAALTFLNVGNLNNEYFVIEFNNKPQVTEDYTQDLDKLASHKPALHATKESGELDAIDLGLETLRRARNPRKVLLVFSSGGYSQNEHKAGPIRKLARQLDAQIFGVTLVMPSVSASNADPMACAGETPGICGRYDLSNGFDTGFDIIDSVGGEGGFASDSATDFETTCRRIGVALRNQYILGYQSTNAAHDGTYRHLEVKLNVQNVPDLRVHTRDGYYAFDPDGGQR
jgi:Ca-activated chloride channel family protein